MNLGKETRSFKNVMNCLFLTLFVGNWLGISYNKNIRLPTTKPKDVTTYDAKSD